MLHHGPGAVDRSRIKQNKCPVHAIKLKIIWPNKPLSPTSPLKKKKTIIFKENENELTGYSSKEGYILK